MISNFLRPKRRNGEENKVTPQQEPPQQHQPQSVPIVPLKRNIDGSVALYFASPHDVPQPLRDALTGFDAASTYLTEKEIKILELYAGVIEDLSLALGFRPCEIDQHGLNIIRTQMQKSLYAKVRLNKSRYGQILNLTVKTIQEYKHISSSDGKENGKSGWRRWL